MQERQLSDIELDLLTFEVIPGEFRVGESALYETKWWDYRHMHPMHATYLFANAYEDAYRRTYPKRGETTLKDKIRVFRCDDPMRDGVPRATGLWRGRRAADQMGIPYRFYCRQALDWSEKLDWAYLARPEDTSNKALAERALLAWQEIYIDVIQAPQDPIYRCTSQVSSRYRRAWEHELCRLIARKANPRHALSHHLRSTKLLSPAIAREKFGKELIDSVLSTNITHD